MRRGAVPSSRVHPVASRQSRAVAVSPGDRRGDIRDTDSHSHTRRHSDSDSDAGAERSGARVRTAEAPPSGRRRRRRRTQGAATKKRQAAAAASTVVRVRGGNSDAALSSARLAISPTRIFEDEELEITNYTVLYYLCRAAPRKRRAEGQKQSRGEKRSGEERRATEHSHTSVTSALPLDSTRLQLGAASTRRSDTPLDSPLAAHSDSGAAAAHCSPALPTRMPAAASSRAVGRSRALLLC